MTYKSSILCILDNQVTFSEWSLILEKNIVISLATLNYDLLHCKCYKYALLNFLCSILMSSLLLSGGQKYLLMLDLGNILLLLSKNEVLFLRIFICHWIFKLRDVCVIHKSRIFGANFVLLQRLDKQEILVLCK